MIGKILEILKQCVNTCCQPGVIIVLAILLVFYLVVKAIINKDKPSNKLYPSFTFGLTIVITFLISMLLFHTFYSEMGKITGSLKNKLVEQKSGKSGRGVKKPELQMASVKPNRYFIYDTDPGNDQYIKSTLSTEQLKKLDNMLNQEKQKEGARLSSYDLNVLGVTDEALLQAYERWRQCYRLNRNRTHVVYPSMRKKL